MRNILALALFIIVTCTARASSYETATIITKTKNAVINIQYPHGFVDKKINLKIQKFINQLKAPFTSNAPLQNFPKNEWDGEWTDRDFIKAKFEIKSNTPHVLSILFYIQIYGRGAAHPNDSINTLNFIDGQEVNLEQLFKPNSDYLSKISSYCYEFLLKKFTENGYKSLKQGTKAIMSNYNNWYLNKKGLVIVFEGPLISPIANGPESYVTIPYTTVKGWACTKKESVIWSNT